MTTLTRKTDTISFPSRDFLCIRDYRATKRPPSLFPPTLTFKMDVDVCNPNSQAIVLYTGTTMEHWGNTTSGFLGRCFER